MCFSLHFIFIPLTDKRNSKIYKDSFIENLAALKYSMNTERKLDRTGLFLIFKFFFSCLVKLFGRLRWDGGGRFFFIGLGGGGGGGVFD